MMDNNVTIEKAKFFEKELAWIKNETIREFTKDCLENLPDYFFFVPASSTGKYHPSYALGEGGLVRHTKAAVAFAKCMLYLEYNNKFTSDQKDTIIAALILHDGFKLGKPGVAGTTLEDASQTLLEHPVICAEWVKARSRNILPEDVRCNLFHAIATHMGQFNKDRFTGEEVLPIPQTEMEFIVVLCDFLASRKYIEFNFDNVNYESDKI